jgi:hypothetical protein
MTCGTPGEVERRHAPEVGLDQDVVCTELRLRLERPAPDHDADHLVGDVERRLQVVATRQWKTHIHDDQQVHARVASEADRQVVHEPAVHEQPPADLDRGKHAGRGHAGAQDRREVTGAQHEPDSGPRPRFGTLRRLHRCGLGPCRDWLHLAAQRCAGQQGLSHTLEHGHGSHRHRCGSRRVER